MEKIFLKPFSWKNRVKRQTEKESVHQNQDGFGLYFDITASAWAWCVLTLKPIHQAGAHWQSPMLGTRVWNFLGAMDAVEYKAYKDYCIFIKS